MYYLNKNGKNYSLDLGNVGIPSIIEGYTDYSGTEVLKPFKDVSTGEYSCDTLIDKDYPFGNSIEEYPEKTGYFVNYYFSKKFAGKNYRILGTKELYAKLFLNGLIFSLSGIYIPKSDDDTLHPTWKPAESLKITLKIENTSNIDIIINKLFCNIGTYNNHNSNYESDLKYYQDEDKTKSCENLRIPANSNITCYFNPPTDSSTSLVPAIHYNTGITNAEGSYIVNTESTGNRTEIIFTTQNSVLSKQQITLSFSNVNSGENSRPTDAKIWTKDPLTYIYKVDDSKKVYYEEKK